MPHDTLDKFSVRTMPPPPPDRYGWPWTIVPHVTDSEGGNFPKFSIVIPSYNQGQYIEETLRSILLQDYPNLEIHVVDGGSTDNTMEIVRKYEAWLSSWVSEKDKGQSDAINKGFARCSGEIFTWLCSDDLLTNGALKAVASIFTETPEVDVVAGACLLQYDDEPERSGIKQVDRKDWEQAPFIGVIWQPSCFFRRRLIGRENLVMNDLHYCMDRELWTYLWSRGTKWAWPEQCLSIFRFTGLNKSVVGGQKIIDEVETIYRSYFKKSALLPRFIRRLWLPSVEKIDAHQPIWIRLAAKGFSRMTAMILLIIYPQVHVRVMQREFLFYGQAPAGK